MKKLFAIILCAAALVGCSYGEGGENNTPATENMVMVTLTADNGSRTYIDGQKGLWSEGDKIQLVVDGAKAGALTLIEGAGTTQATFRGPISITEDYAKEYSVSAYYPADADVTVGSGNVLTYNLDVKNSNGAEGFMYTNLTTSNLVKDVENKQVVMTIDNFTFYRTMAVVKVVNDNTEVTSYAGAKFVSTTAVFGQTATINPANGSNGITWSNLTNEVGVKGSSDLYIGVPAYSADGTYLTASLFDGDNKDLASKVFACNSLVRNNLYTVTFTTPTPEVDPLITLPDMSGVGNDFRAGTTIFGIFVPTGSLIAGNANCGSFTDSNNNTYRGLNVTVTTATDNNGNEYTDVLKLDNSQTRGVYNEGTAEAYNQTCFYFPTSLINGTSSNKVILTFDAVVIYAAYETGWGGLAGEKCQKVDEVKLHICQKASGDSWASDSYGTDICDPVFVVNEGYDYFGDKVFGTNYPTVEPSGEYWQSYSITIDNFTPKDYVGFSIKGNDDGMAVMIYIRNITIQYVN